MKKSKNVAETKAYDAVLSQRPPRQQMKWQVAIDGQPSGDLVIELAHDIVPKTVQHFIQHCGQASNMPVHALRNNVAFVAGEVQASVLPDENFCLQFSEPGVVGFTNSGVDTNSAQFFVAFEPLPHLNGRNVAFGKVVEGLDVLARINAVYAPAGKPLTSVDLTTQPL